MEVRVNPKTTEALQRDGTLRCLLQVRYTQEDRHFVSAIAWARKKAEDVSRSLLKGAGLGAETATFSVDLKGYKLGQRNHRSYICYDIFLENCSSAARERIEGCIRQPIHLITKRGNVFIARRAPHCDKKVALFFEMDQERSQPPGPLLPEVESPPNYRSGQRLDQPRVEAATYAEGDAKNKLEILIQSAAEKVARYVGGNFGEHIINQLELQLYITKSMVAGPKENAKNATAKKVDPVSEKHARNMVTNITTFLSRSLRAQKKTNEVKSVLEHAAERLEEEIVAKKNANDGAKRSLEINSEKNAENTASDDNNNPGGGRSRMER